MNYRGAILTDIQRLIELLSSRCTDQETLAWLSSAVADRSTWQKAHGVHNQIRNKTLKAERSGNRAAVAQYLFEETCAKTLYNLSGASAPFDSDSPYWVLPNAIALAKHLGVPEEFVLSCITVQQPPLNDA